MSIPEVASLVLAAGSAGAVVTTPLLIRARRRSGRLERARAEAQALSEQLAAHAGTMEAELRHLVRARLPALITHLAHAHVQVPGPLEPHAQPDGTEQEFRALLNQVARALTEERVRVDAAARAALRGTTKVMQAKSYQLQDVVAELLQRYESPRIAEDLMRLDALNEQILRRIQAAGVVSGATAGLTRTDSHLAEIVVGAQARIPDYQRVHVTNQLPVPIGVVGRAAEPLAVVITELLGNAVHHSHGTLPVDVSVHHSDTGAVVVIDDDGVGMHPEELEFAHRMLSGRQPLQLVDLGDPPRLGFAAIGQLVTRYDLRVTVDKRSPYGGVRAVVYVPQHLLVALPAEGGLAISAMTPQAAPRTRRDRAEAGHRRVPDLGLVPQSEAENLPRRSRRAQQAAADPAPAPLPVPSAQVSAQVSVESRTPQQASAPWGAFQRGASTGRRAAEHADGSTAS